MSYTMRRPTYEAIQWDGENVDDCQAFHLQWFSQPPPPPPWQSDPGSPPFAHDADAHTLTIHPGYTLAVGDWMVNGGTYPPDQAWAGTPEVVSADQFSVKYSLQT
jgi:hypothetical protein